MVIFFIRYLKRELDPTKYWEEFFSETTCKENEQIAQ